MADGWVRARCPALESLLSANIAAFSILGAPDFFPLCGQRELKEWVASEPLFASEDIWNAKLDPLSNVRFLVNQSLEGNYFPAQDWGATAIVSLPIESSNPPAQHSEVALAQRQSWLPDFASGVFNPGWEVGKIFDSDSRQNILC